MACSPGCLQMEYLDTYKICLKCGKRTRLLFPRCDCGSREFSENVVPGKK